MRIKTTEEFDAAVKELDALLDKPETRHDDERLLELSDAIEQYEDETLGPIE